MALSPVKDVLVGVELAGVPRATPGCGRREVGRISLYLLDTDIDENDDEDRLVCDRLYGGGAEERIRQEIVLGIGGMRVLRDLGKLPEVFHLNEGHAGFLALERIRRCHARRRAQLRRGPHRGPARRRVHHPHPGARRHRPLPAAS